MSESLKIGYFSSRIDRMTNRIKNSEADTCKSSYITELTQKISG